MSSEDKLHNASSNAKQVMLWYKKAQIDYADHYLKMYVAYNAWYREVTNKINDRQAIGVLKKRFIIWDDYCNDKTMKTLKVYLERLAELTQREPMVCIGTYWDGEIKNNKDWRSLIEYWYQVRCRVVHGAEINPKYVWYTYETLDIFMNEIIERITHCLSLADTAKIYELSSLAEENAQRPERFQQLQHKLYQKYIAMPDIWQVDMQRV